MPEPTPPRYHALDAVRAVALLLGIVLHGVISFMPSMKDIGWPIVDDSSSEFLNAVFLWIHVFRMPLFFLMAGFFARLMVERKGIARFAQDRTRRIALPFLLGCLIIVPLSEWVLMLAAEQEGKPLFHPYIPPGTPLELPMMHLWFLYLLMLIYAVFGASRWLILRIDARGRSLPAADRATVWLASHAAGPLALAAPLAAALYVYPYWWVSLGIPTPDYSLVPNFPAGLGFGIAFALGWLLHRQPETLSVWAARWPVNLAFAVLTSALCVAIAGTAVAAQVEDDRLRLLYGASYCASCWYWCFGLVGVALRFLPHAQGPWRYLADASYWMYLWHMPLVLALQAWVMHWPLHWSIKAAFILGLAIGLLLLSYHWWVRGRFIGNILNGKPASR